MAAIPETASPLLTAEDLLEMAPECEHVELVEGVLCPVSPVSWRSSRIGFRIARRLADFCEERDLGEVNGADMGFVLARKPDTVRSPDASFVRKERLPAAGDEHAQSHYLELAPDLAVEVVSPSNRAGELTARVLDFLDAGTQLVWVVEPRLRMVTAWTPDRTARILRDGEVLDGGDVLPGFTLPLAELFAD